MPRRQCSEKISRRSHQESNSSSIKFIYFILAGASFIFSFFLAPSALAKNAWTCPDFGPCQFRIVFGSCSAELYFEYSLRPQTEGGKPFWKSDEPKPCVISMQVRGKKERTTFPKYRCDEILELFETLADKKEWAPQVGDQDFYYCEATKHTATALMIYPDQSFKNGQWKTLNRQVLQINSIHNCQAKFQDKELFCADLEGEERHWFSDVLGKIKWSIKDTRSVQYNGDSRNKLPPGDFMRRKK